MIRGDAAAPAGRPRTILYTTLALCAFATNSILCRLALGDGSIDPASFTALRLLSGTLVLLAILLLRGRRPGGDWLSGLALFLYAAPFSFAYVSLGVGTGALLAFGAVQLTMLAAGIRQGERPPATEWWGILAAVGGLVYLVSPGLRAPSLAGSALMIVAGVAWGIYSLRGRRVAHPVAATAGNFLRALPFTLLVSLAFLHQADISPGGAILAVVSGALTSGVGYVIWYAALRGLTATRAAAAQLATPALAALGGVLFLGEPVTLRLIVAGALILGGVALALRRR